MEKVRLQSKICTFWNMLTVLFFVFYLNWLTDYFYFTFQSIRLLSLIVNYLSFSLFLSLLLGCCLLVSSFLNLHGPWIQVEHIFSYINDTWGSFCILCLFWFWFADLSSLSLVWFWIKHGLLSLAGCFPQISLALLLLNFTAHLCCCALLPYCTVDFMMTWRHSVLHKAQAQRSCLNSRCHFQNVSKFFVPIPKQIWPTVVCTNACFHSFKCNSTVELLHNKLVEKCMSEWDGLFKRKSMLYFCWCYFDLLYEYIKTSNSHMRVWTSSLLCSLSF